MPFLRVLSRECLLWLDHCHDISYRPHMLTDARFHRRSNPERLVHARKVVVHVEQGNHGDMILNLLAECVGQAE